MSTIFDPRTGEALVSSGFASAQRRARGIHSATFLSSGSWTCPSDVYWVSLEMCGGGGGGGGCTQQAADNNPRGANGGSGASSLSGAIPVTPGVVYTMTVGGGGSGGAAGSSTSDSTDGSTGGTTSIVSGDGILRLYAIGGPGGARMTSGQNPAAASSVPLASEFVNRFGAVFGNGAIGGIGRGWASAAATAAVAGGSVENVPGGSLVYPSAGPTTTYVCSGPGGASLFGRGANGVVLSFASGTSPWTGVAGAAATEFGGGGSGGFGGVDYSGYGSPTLTNAAGGAGGPGFIRIQWEA